VSDELYGYEYASRSLLKDLLFSYATWDRVDGYHGDPSVVAGMSKFYEDFGATYSSPPGDTNFPYPTIDGYDILFATHSSMYGLYGSPSECGGVTYTCKFYSELSLDKDSAPTMTLQVDRIGWDDVQDDVFRQSVDQEFRGYGSFIFREVSDDCSGFPGGGNTGGEFPGGGNTNGCFPGGGNGHASVPEPGTLPLLALGLTGLVGIRKFRKSQSINS
jgi:hypothetical protein